MFAKENTKAFIYVTHYLFNVFDPRTFQRHFHWPLTDRKYEAEYRLSAVEYLNVLIRQNKLTLSLADPSKPGKMLTKITATYVIHPGGFRFQQLLLDIIKMVMNSVIESKAWTGLKPENNVASQLMVIRGSCNDLKQNSNQLVARVNEADVQLKQRINYLDKALQEVLLSSKENVNKLLEIMEKLKKVNLKRFNEIKTEDEEIKRRLGVYREFCKTARSLTKPYEVKELESKGFNATLATLRQQFEPSTSLQSQTQSTDEEKTNETGCKLVQILNLCSLTLPCVIGLMQQFEKIDIRDVKSDSKKISPLLQSTNELSSEIIRFLRIINDSSPVNNSTVSTSSQPMFDIGSQLILIPPPVTINLRRRMNASLVPRLMQSASDTVNLRNQSLIDTITGRRGLPSIYRSMKNLTAMPSGTDTSGTSGTKTKKKLVTKKPLIDSAALLLKKPAKPKPRRSLSPIPSYSVVMANNLEQGGHQRGPVLSSTVLEYSMQSQLATPRVPFVIPSPLPTMKVEQVGGAGQGERSCQDSSSGIDSSEGISPSVNSNITVLNFTSTNKPSHENDSNLIPIKNEVKAGFNSIASSIVEEKENILNISDNILINDSF